MKTTIIIIIFFTFTFPCIAELTESDIRQIRQIVREEIEPLKIEIAEIKGKMATKDDIIAVKGDIISMQQKLGDKIDTLYGIIIAAFVTLIVVIAVPQIIIAYRERRESQLSKEVDDLKQRIAELEKKRILT
ncbi:hypothetical protein FJZ31_22285 [Candidatus Poribacteria bacterium]|nr:hypothetical protein [Candidatus Poribacteria bacterium]